MKLKIDLEKNPAGQKGQILRPSHEGDAGYDLVASSEPLVNGAVVVNKFYRNISYIEYDTNVVLQPNKENGEHLFYSLLFPRSSISKYNLVLANSVGVIDSGYENTIKVRFKYIIQPEDIYLLEEKDNDSVKYPTVQVNMGKIYKKGDKIAQLVFSKHIHPQFLNYDFGSKDEARGTGGFGSSGE